MKLFGIILLMVGFYCIAEAALTRGVPDKVTECKSGTCIDYCNYKGSLILPGESRNEGCSKVECLTDFSTRGEQ